MNAQALPDDWREWLRSNRERGCALDELFHRAAEEGFRLDEISAELGGYRPPQSEGTESKSTEAANEGERRLEPWFSLYHAPLTSREQKPRAWRLDTDKAQIYEIPDLLTREECEALIEVIDSSLQPSTVTRGPADYRTSRTCHMRGANPALVKEIDERIARLIGVDPAYSEPIQGQRYDEGQYFKAHTDWFSPGTDEYEEHTKPGGQRTWTVMIWLNRVECGGATRFERLGRDFYPVPGSAVAWNNCGIDGTPNHDTLHEAMPVTSGTKYVITKWFREKTGRNDVSQPATQRVRAPRIATSAILKIKTPPALQALIMAEYAQMNFAAAGGEMTWDSEYGAKQHGAISVAGGESPSVGHAPLSAELMDACYAMLTPMLEKWAGCKLARSWGYGIRSYGRGSILHLHRDRIDTHVISCIVHVDDRSDAPWPLDFIDHDGEHHQVSFERGETLFYESLCPHARLTPFAGDYYRNMYLHWRPENWDPMRCQGIKAKYASLEECIAEMKE